MKPSDIAIHALFYQPEKKRPAIATDSLLLIKDKGIEGDCHSGGERQVSLLGADAMHQAKEMAGEGLCLNKFTANIVASGMPVLSTGQCLISGEAIIQVTQVGKHCYPDQCELSSKGIRCPLQSCAYGIIKQGGRLHIGDAIKL